MLAWVCWAVCQPAFGGVGLTPSGLELPRDWAACAQHAARHYGVPYEALVGILLQEGGRPGWVAINEDGSHDLGVMQINDVWQMSRLQQQGWTREAIIWDGCANIHAAAWILAGLLQEEKGRVWYAIARYHTGHLHTPGKLARARGYVLGVWKRIQQWRKHR